MGGSWEARGAGQRAVRWDPRSARRTLPGLIPRTHSSATDPQIRTWGVLGLCAQGRQPTPRRFEILFWEDKALRSRAGGVGQRWRGTTGYRGLRLLDGGQSAEEQARAPPHPAPGGCRDRPLRPGRVKPADEGLSERLWGGQWWGPTPGPLLDSLLRGRPPDPQTTTRGGPPCAF